MKYKVLLMGRSKAIVDDFFTHLGIDYEVQTTSLRYADILNHIKFYTPDVLIYCMHKEAVDTWSFLPTIRTKLEQFGIPFVIIGNEEECELFQNTTIAMAGLVLTKPIQIRAIGERVMKFLDAWKEEHPQITIEKIADSKEEEHLEEVSENTAPVRKHVLVVDDDPMMLKLIKEQLKESYTVATAVSGNIALKFLENKKTDLIILDYDMPRESGADVLQKIRDNEATSNLPVIFLTGVTEREKIQKVLSFKPQGYLLKPIEREKLLKIISNTLNNF